MVYTITLNPCIDYIMYADDYNLGEINRSKSEEFYAGGKGINVSIMLKNLGVESTVLGFVAGDTGELIKKEVNKSGLNADFVTVKNGFSRINVKIKSALETDINGNGPLITSDDTDKLMHCLECANKGDYLVLAGSACRGSNDYIYADIMSKTQSKDLHIIVDATGDLLLNTLEFKPFLIKPNNFELSELSGKTLDTEEEIIESAVELQNKGARNVLVSRGGKGAILVCEDGKVFNSCSPKGEVINTTGAGDSMVAGFIAGCIMLNDFEYAFRMAICSGSATAFSHQLADKDKIMNLMSDYKLL